MKFKDILKIAYGVISVFGGIGCLIEADYVSAKWSTPMYVLGGALLGVFAIVCVIGIVGQNRNK